MASKNTGQCAKVSKHIAGSLSHHLSDLYLMLVYLHVYEMTTAASLCPVGKRKKTSLLTMDHKPPLTALGTKQIAVWRRTEGLDKFRIL